MIPKIIHYIWLGGKPLPELAEQCIASWQKHMPDWQIMRWDETTLKKSNCWLDQMPLYVQQAYAARKFAFVSDYIRLWALEQYGGLYMDTDVEVLKSFEPLMQDVAFIGLEESRAHLPGTCVMACEPHCKWVKDMSALYDGIEFVKPDGTLDLTTNVQRMGVVMMREFRNERMNELTNEGVSELGKYWKQVQFIEEWGLRVYTHDYFSPITSTRVMRKTKNTYSIHHFMGSWMETKRKGGWREWTITREIINALVQIKRRINKH